ncbi:MAG: hypothetical protein HYW78_01535 [Parcubacteria group bacterium]|nr:hypothetical protein [Parcubacteria group bacterium]
MKKIFIVLLFLFAPYVFAQNDFLETIKIGTKGYTYVSDNEDIKVDFIVIGKTDTSITLVVVGTKDQDKYVSVDLTAGLTGAPIFFDSKMQGVINSKEIVRIDGKRIKLILR